MLRLIGSQPRKSPSESSRRGTEAADPLMSLVVRVQRGDRVAERTLLMAVGPAILNVVRRVFGPSHDELDDVCQEACLALINAIPTFRGECSVLHFACRVALLTALASRRKTALTRQSNAEADDVADEGPLPAERLDLARRCEAVRELVEQLPPEQGEVLALHVALGHTVEETASMMGTPIDTVRSRLRRGLDKLREKLKQNPRLREVVGGKP